MLGSLWRLARSLGQTSIEVYEWQEGDVRRRRLPNSPDIKLLTKRCPNLAFNGWSLAHAVVKADYLDRRSLAMPGLGFLLQAEGLLELGKAPLQLKPGASKALNDVSATSLSGRVGQGLAILYGHSLGFEFAAHLRSHVHGLPSGSAGAAHKDEAMADFLFASKHGTILVESKGSFALRENDPSAVKSVLKDALTKQVDPWMNHLKPAPSNGFVVYSCLREPSWVPSAIFVVDPEESGGEEQGVPFTQENVLRENYAAWLRAMGLSGAAARLLGTAASQESRQAEAVLFVIAEVDGRQFAFRENDYGWPDNLWHQRPPVVGIDLAVLRAISGAISGSNVNFADALRELHMPRSENRGQASIFPDGSVFGPLDEKLLDLELIPV